MTYEYDVFLSYRQGRLFGRWVHETFLELFEDYLTEALNKPKAAIFVDRGEIKAGDTLPPRIKDALARSRCMVAVWVPSYFHSHWCQRELSAMLWRERQLGYRTPQKPGGLVLPIRLFDGAYFPRFTQHIVQFDCTRFARVRAGFLDSPRYLEFQDKLIEWVDAVAQTIQQAPDWQPEWLNNASFDDLIENFATPALSFFPGLE